MTAITLTKMLLPWDDYGPVLLKLPDRIDSYLPVFTKVEHLVSLLELHGIPFTKVKQIEDEAEFLGSLPYMVGDGGILRIMVNPTITDEGLVYSERHRDDA